MVMDQDAVALVQRLIAVAATTRMPDALARWQTGPDKTIRVSGGWIKPAAAVEARDAIEAAEAALATVAAQAEAAAGGGAQEISDAQG